MSAKNAILIVEFAKMEYESGKSLIDAALTGARLRLRPILMTAFAFILGCVPLCIATGAGAISRRVLGTVVIGGMLALDVLAISSFRFRSMWWSDSAITSARKKRSLKLNQQSALVRKEGMTDASRETLAVSLFCFYPARAKSAPITRGPVVSVPDQYRG